MRLPGSGGALVPKAHCLFALGSAAAVGDRKNMCGSGFLFLAHVSSEYISKAKDKQRSKFSFRAVSGLGFSVHCLYLFGHIQDKLVV